MSARDLNAVDAPASAGAVMRAADAAYRGINRVFVGLTHVALFAMVTLTSADALGRYLFNSPLPGMEELSDEFFMPALIYLVAAHIYDTGGHISITTLTELFPARLRAFMVWLGDLLGTVFFGLVTWAIARRMVEAYSLREYSSSPLNYLLGHSYAIVVAGCALLTLRMAVAVVTARHPSAKPHDI